MKTIKAALAALFDNDKRMSYRRLLAWLGTCGLLVAGRVSESSWLYITLAFMGLEVAGQIQAAMAKSKALEPRRPSDEPTPEPKA